MSESPDISRENQWLAALCHFSGSILFVGMVVPLVTLLNEKERGSKLRAQALQALVFQAAGFVLYMIFTGFALLACYGTFIPLAFTSGGIVGQVEGYFSLLSIFFAILLVFLALVSMIAVPAYIILALAGGWQTLKGKDYRYPLFGAWLYKRTTPNWTGTGSR